MRKNENFFKNNLLHYDTTQIAIIIYITILWILFVNIINTKLLGEVFAISGIIKVRVGVIS